MIDLRLLCIGIPVAFALGLLLAWLMSMLRRRER